MEFGSEWLGKRLGVLRPRLPVADRLLPYLRAIDESRIYSNHGPMVSTLESRLSQEFQMPKGSMVCTSSGTAAMIGAILARAGRASVARPLAIIPAFTFVATAAAVEQCGYQPYLVDVSPQDWVLNPASLSNHSALHRAGVVVPVAPFGRPVPQAPWRAFNRSTGIPVIIDGAASFDTVMHAPHDYLGDVPVTLSFHATKSFGTGEGGAVTCNDIEFTRHVERCLNFGFYDVRDSRSPSTNGKMSEYCAAVGLAELDGWAEKYLEWSRVAGLYREAMESVQLSEMLCVHPDISTCYTLLMCRTAAQAREAENSLDHCNIDCRRWYGAGVQGHSYYFGLPHDQIDTTVDILSRLLGLPVAPDLTRSDVDRVMAALRPALSA